MIKILGLLALTAFNIFAIPNSNNELKTIKQVNKTADNSFVFPDHKETSFGRVVDSSVDGIYYSFTFSLDKETMPQTALPDMGDIRGIFYFDYYNQLTGHFERFAEKTKAQTLGFMEKTGDYYKLSTNKDSIMASVATDNAWKAYNGDIIPMGTDYINSNLRNLGFYIDNEDNGNYEYINIVPTNKNVFDDYIKDAYNKGHAEGYQTGFDDAWETAYNTGKEFGLNQGYDKGYNAGYANGIAESDEGVANGVFGMLGNAFTSVSSILNIEVFENITIGTFLLVPLTIAIIFTIVKLLGL